MKKVIIFSAVVLVIGGGTWLYFRQREAKRKANLNNQASGSLPVQGVSAAPASDNRMTPVTTPAPTGDLVPPVSVPAKAIIHPMPSLLLGGSLYADNSLSGLLRRTRISKM